MRLDSGHGKQLGEGRGVDCGRKTAIRVIKGASVDAARKIGILARSLSVLQLIAGSKRHFAGGNIRSCC